MNIDEAAVIRFFSNKAKYLNKIASVDKIQNYSKHRREIISLDSDDECGETENIFDDVDLSDVPLSLEGAPKTVARNLFHLKDRHENEKPKTARDQDKVMIDNLKKEAMEFADKYTQKDKELKALEFKVSKLAQECTKYVEERDLVNNELEKELMKKNTEISQLKERVEHLQTDEENVGDTGERELKGYWKELQNKLDRKALEISEKEKYVKSTILQKEEEIKALKALINFKKNTEESNIKNINIECVNQQIPIQNCVESNTEPKSKYDQIKRKNENNEHIKNDHELVENGSTLTELSIKNEQLLEQIEKLEKIIEENAQVIQDNVSEIGQLKANQEKNEIEKNAIIEDLVNSHNLKLEQRENEMQRRMEDKNNPLANAQKELEVKEGLLNIAQKDLKECTEAYLVLKNRLLTYDLEWEENVKYFKDQINTKENDMKDIYTNHEMKILETDKQKEEELLKKQNNHDLELSNVAKSNEDILKQNEAEIKIMRMEKHQLERKLERMALLSNNQEPMEEPMEVQEEHNVDNNVAKMKSPNSETPCIIPNTETILPNPMIKFPTFDRNSPDSELISSILEITSPRPGTTFTNPKTIVPNPQTNSPSTDIASSNPKTTSPIQNTTSPNQEMTSLTMSYLLSPATSPSLPLTASSGLKRKIETEKMEEQGAKKARSGPSSHQVSDLKDSSLRDVIFLD